MNLAEGVINTFVEAGIRASVRMDGLAAPGVTADTATVRRPHPWLPVNSNKGQRRGKVKQISRVR